MLLYFTFIIFCNTVFQVKAQDVKTWRSDMNFNNPRNWKNGQLPCSKQKIVFEASSPVAVFMPESLTFSEIILPINGQLIFPKNSELTSKKGIQGEHCSGDVAEFIPREDFWYDPDNWNITSTQAFPLKASTRNSAVPHAYQVPCQMDEAWFPVDTSFRVHVIYPSTRISKMVIGYQEYTQEDFNLLKRSDTGKLLFPDDPNILITPSSCTDATGCLCGNEAHAILPTICKFKVPCPDLECLDPIAAVGHCCSMCAAKITATFGPGFRMDELMQLFDHYLSKEKFRKVESYTAKIGSGNFQSTFVDNTGNNQLANQVAQQIHDALLADKNGARSYGINTLEIVRATSWKEGSSKYESSSTGMSSGATATLVIFIIMGISLGIAYCIYRKRQIPGFSFARFDLRGDKIELELGTTPHEDLEPEESISSAKAEENKAFDNPVYGTSVATEPSPTVEESIEGKDFVENPMFMIFEDSPKKDAE